MIQMDLAESKSEFERAKRGRAKGVGMSFGFQIALFLRFCLGVYFSDFCLGMYFWIKTIVQTAPLGAHVTTLSATPRSCDSVKC